jgi:hypothetical protein
MGLSKPEEQKFEAINCTLPKDDVKLAKELGTIVKPDGRTVINTSLGFRKVFETVRIVGVAISVLEQIRQNPNNAQKLAESFFVKYYKAKTDS